MAQSIKTKIASGIGVMFGLLLIISIVALVAINLLSSKTENLLTANYKTIRYCNQMMHAMDAIFQRAHQLTRSLKPHLLRRRKTLQNRAKLRQRQSCGCTSAS